VTRNPHRETTIKSQCLAATALLLHFAGCGSDYDNKADLDARINNEWLNDARLIDAVTWLEKARMLVGQ